MKNLKVRVENGMLVGEAPPGLPEGTELELCVADPEDDLDEADLARLNAALERAWESVQSGRVRPSDEVMSGEQ